MTLFRACTNTDPHITHYYTNVFGVESICLGIKAPKNGK